MFDEQWECRGCDVEWSVTVGSSCFLCEKIGAPALAELPWTSAARWTPGSEYAPLWRHVA